MLQYIELGHYNLQTRPTLIICSFCKNTWYILIVLGEKIRRARNLSLVQSLGAICVQIHIYIVRMSASLYSRAENARIICMVFESATLVVSFCFYYIGDCTHHGQRCKASFIEFISKRECFNASAGVRQKIFSGIYRKLFKDTQVFSKYYFEYTAIFTKKFLIILRNFDSNPSNMRLLA